MEFSREQIKAMKEEGKYIVKTFAGDIEGVPESQLESNDAAKGTTEKKGSFIYKVFSYDREAELANLTPEQVNELAWEHLLYHKLMSDDRRELEYSLGLKEHPSGTRGLTPEQKEMNKAIKGASPEKLAKARKLLGLD